MYAGSHDGPQTWSAKLVVLSRVMMPVPLDTKGYVESECHLAMLSIASLEMPALVAQLPVRS